MPEETKHEVFLKRAQLVIAVLVGVVTLIVGVYNAKRTLFSKSGPGQISMAVRTDKGQAVGQAAVQILNLQGGVVATAETGSDGKYVKKGLQSGNYTVKVNKNGYQPEMLVVSVDPSQMAEVNLELKPTASPMRSAVEEVGASWIKDLGAPRK